MTIFQILTITTTVSVIALFLVAVFTNVNKQVMMFFIFLFVAIESIFMMNELVKDKNVKNSFSETASVISAETGMTAINCFGENEDKIINNQNTYILFKDNENIYNCEVVYEDGSRNYYFRSGGSSIKLNKY